MPKADPFWTSAAVRAALVFVLGGAASWGAGEALRVRDRVGELEAGRALLMQRLDFIAATVARLDTRAHP